MINERKNLVFSHDLKWWDFAWGVDIRVFGGPSRLWVYLRGSRSLKCFRLEEIRLGLAVRISKGGCSDDQKLLTVGDWLFRWDLMAECSRRRRKETGEGERRGIYRDTATVASPHHSKKIARICNRLLFHPSTRSR